MEGEQTEGEWQRVHPSKAPTQEGQSSARLLHSFRLSKQALADTRCKAGPQLLPPPSPAAPSPSTARTLSPASSEPATVPTIFSQGILGRGAGGGCYGCSPHCTAGKLRQGPLSRAQRVQGRSFCLLLHPGLRGTRDWQEAVTVTLPRRTQRSPQLSSPLKSGFKLDFTVTSPQVTGCSGCCFN